MSVLCGEVELQALVQKMNAGASDPLPEIDALIRDFPDDPRLNFLKGSVLIGLGRHIEAHALLSRAVELAPEFDLARFQLGLFELTSGEAQNAIRTWGPLDRLADTHYLRKFADGLRRLIVDDFDGAIALLRQGQSLNSDTPPLNHDMQLIIDRCLALTNDSEPISETSFILGQFKGGGGGLH